MKRFSFFLMAMATLVMTAIGCKDPVEIDPDTPTDGAKVVGTFKQAEIIAAASDLYEFWLENSDNVPTTMTVGSTELTQPQYIYALAKTMTDIQAGKKDDVEVLSYKMATNPERDSYDQLEIAVFNGPKNEENTEDLGNVATRMIAAMAEKGQVPNQTLFERNGSPIAFSTNRATICFLRALSEYAPNSKMPEKIATDYLSTSATIKGFATQFVKYLEVWENSVAEVLSADGSRNSGNGKPFENAHFIPIPYTGSAVNADGTEQFDPKWQPYYEPEVAGVKYTAAQCWGIALKALIDLCSIEGSTVWEVERTPETPAHTLGNGKSLNSPIPMLEEWFIWGQHPWYENENDGGPVKYNGEPITEVDIAFMMRVMPWHLTRSSQLGAIGNFQQFGMSKESTLYYDGYIGLICPMREFLIAARIFKYILDNDITSNVYDAIKDVKFSFDLYGSEKPDIALDVDNLNFTYEGGEQKVKVTTKDQAWTATVEGEGITVSPDSGAAGAETEVTITAAANTGGSRVATVTFTTATGKSKSVSINQGACPTNATIREFATEYVKLIDVWMKNVGTVNTTTGIGAQGDNLDIENAHYIPDETTITVGETVFNLADALELASRSYLLLRGYDGHNTTTYGRNFPIPTIDEAYTMDSNIPETHSYTWGAHPYAEPTNGEGWFRYVTDEGEFEIVKVDILDDYSHRHTNYPGPGGQISNFCSYPVDYLAGYKGTFCAKRVTLAYAYFFKYMLENNLSDAKSIPAEQTFKAPLFHDADASKPTIRAFAEEYVKFIDIWKNTTGTVNYMCPTGVVTPDFKYDGVPNIENGHYIPLDTKLTVAGAEYTTSEVFDLAIRSYLALRGYDATDETSVGANSFQKAEKAATMDDNFLPARPLTWGSAPFNETGSVSETGAVSGNGGNLKKGTPPNGEDKVDIALLDNFAQRNCNYATVKNDNAIGNMAGYNNRPDCPGYYGCASGHRMLLTYAYFFKYMLDNNLSDATNIPADQTFESYHFGEGLEIEETPNLKGWAKEFVKVLDVWESHVGTVDADGKHNTPNGTQFENVHFIPIGEPSSNPYGNEGNQYDAQYQTWTVEYAGTTYTSAQAWEIAIRGLLNLVTAEGEEGLPKMDDRNTPWTLTNAASFSTAKVPGFSENCAWGSTPWYEYDSTVTYNGAAIEEVGIDFIVKCASWHIVRGLIKTAGNANPLGAIGNFQEFGTSSSQLNLDGYEGLISPIRELLIVARIYDYLLENNIDSNVYDAVKDQKFDFDLY